MSNVLPPRDHPDRLSLRERKKLRTRQALIDTALELFTERGFNGVTLDELCDAVEISKRTFFRYFTSKEDVAMAPTQDLWLVFLDDLETREPDGRPVLEMLQDALSAALDQMSGGGWSKRVMLSRQLAEKTPSMDAHGLHFCQRVCRTALATLHRRLDFADPYDLHLRLAVEILLAAFHCGMATWASRQGTPTCSDLAADFREACAALPESLTLTVNPRSE